MSTLPDPRTSASVTHRHGPRHKWIKGLSRTLRARGERGRWTGRWRGIHNGLDPSSRPALWNWSAGDSVMVRIPWRLTGLEGTTPGIGLSVGRLGWSPVRRLGHRLGREARMSAGSSRHERGRWTARMHNSTVGQALEGLWSARAGTLMPVTTNEVLRGIQPRRDMI